MSTRISPEENQAGDASEAFNVSLVERLFIEEARLLDDWKLDEWLARVIAKDATYLIPPLDVRDADPADALFLIDDDYTTLQSRVSQLMTGVVWAENPRSRTRRLITNVELLESFGDHAVAIANFAVWRFQYEHVDIYVGRYRNVVVREDGALKWRQRRAELDIEVLRPHGKISFIL